MNVRVEYTAAPIRHIAVQCPRCDCWFNGREITTDQLSYEGDIRHAHFRCLVCNYEFGGIFSNVKIEEVRYPEIYEVRYPEIYEGCLQRKEVLE